MKLFYESAEQLEKGFSQLEKFERVPDNQFRILYEKRNEIDAEIGKALLNYTQTAKKISDLEQINNQQYQSKRNIQNVKDQIRKLNSKTEIQIFTEETQKHNSNCNVCSVTCHYEC